MRPGDGASTTVGESEECEGSNAMTLSPGLPSTIVGDSELSGIGTSAEEPPPIETLSPGTGVVSSLARAECLDDICCWATAPKTALDGSLAHTPSPLSPSRRKYTTGCLSSGCKNGCAFLARLPLLHVESHQPSGSNPAPLLRLENRSKLSQTRTLWSAFRRWNSLQLFTNP